MRRGRTEEISALPVPRNRGGEGACVRATTAFVSTSGNTATANAHDAGIGDDVSGRTTPSTTEAWS